MQIGVLRMAALVYEVLGGLCPTMNLNDLPFSRMRLAEVPAKPALPFMYRQHGDLLLIDDFGWRPSVAADHSSDHRVSPAVSKPGVCLARR